MFIGASFMIENGYFVKTVYAGLVLLVEPRLPLECEHCEQTDQQNHRFTQARNYIYHRYFYFLVKIEKTWRNL